MKEEFVPYQESLELKALGFDEPCLAKYTVVPEDGIDWFMIPEQGIANTRYGSSKNYNTKIFEKEGTISAPTFSQAFRWFRKKHNLVHRIDRDGGWWVCAILDLCDEKEQGTIEIYLENCYPDSYEEAELACLRKLIQIVKEKK